MVCKMICLKGPWVARVTGVARVSQGKVQVCLLKRLQVYFKFTLSVRSYLGTSRIPSSVKLDRESDWRSRVNDSSSVKRSASAK